MTRDERIEAAIDEWASVSIENDGTIAHIAHHDLEPFLHKHGLILMDKEPSEAEIKVALYEWTRSRISTQPERARAALIAARKVGG